MTDHYENKSDPSFFFSIVPKAFSINSELVFWKCNFMGDDDTDGILVSMDNWTITIMLFLK